MRENPQWQLPAIKKTECESPWQLQCRIGIHAAGAHYRTGNVLQCRKSRSCETKVRSVRMFRHWPGTPQAFYVAIRVAILSRFATSAFAAMSNESPALRRSFSECPARPAFSDLVAEFVEWLLSILIRTIQYPARVVPTNAQSPYAVVHLIDDQQSGLLLE